MDANSAFDDMIVRLERLYSDKVQGLADEVAQIINTIERAEVDRKDACLVLYAMRLDIAKNIVCNNVAGTAVFTNDDTQWRIYEGMFDDFHYDIGHGKGTGESGSSKRGRGVGDYEMDVGSRAMSIENSFY